MCQVTYSQAEVVLFEQVGAFVGGRVSTKIFCLLVSKLDEEDCHIDSKMHTLRIPF